MTAPNWFGWIDTYAELRNEKRKARQYAAEVGNDIGDLDAVILAMALDACQTDPDHILNANTFWADTEDQTALVYGDKWLGEAEAEHADWLDHQRTQEDARY